MFVFSTGYVAGFVDPEVNNRSDLFDVYVNLPDSVITVSQSAKGTVHRMRKLYASNSVLNPESRISLKLTVQFLNTEAMVMGKLHKDIGHLIVQSAEDTERSDSQVIKVSTHSQHVCLQLQLRKMLSNATTARSFIGHFCQDKRDPRQLGRPG